MAKCKFCGDEVVWVKEGRRNRAFKPDGTEYHTCEAMMNSLKSAKSLTIDSLSPEEIAKYEAAMNTHVKEKSKKKK